MKRSTQTRQSKKKLVLELQKVRELSQDGLAAALGGVAKEMTACVGSKVDPCPW
jgi:hypothetical protein